MTQTETDLLQVLVDVFGRILRDEIVDLLLPARVLLVLALGQAEVGAAAAQAGRHVLGQAVHVVRPGGGGAGGGTVVALKTAFRNIS